MREPILLAVELSNGHFMSCRLLHPDRHTLPALNRWYREMMEAIFLIELGNLHAINRTQAVAMHRDWGEPWPDHQPRFSPNIKHLKALARNLKARDILLNQNNQWKPLGNASNG